METWQYRGKEFVIVRFTIDHYTNINVYDLGHYTPFFGDDKVGEYLHKNPECSILILEEAEVDEFFRRPLLTELGPWRKKYNLKNEVVIFYQGTGQENWPGWNTYLKKIPQYVTYVQSHTAPYNLIHNWIKTYSQAHFTYEDLESLFIPEYSLFPHPDLEFKRKFIVMAGKPRVPRLMMLGAFLKNDLLKESYYNFGREYIKRFKEYMAKDLVDKVLKHHGFENYSGRLEIDFIPSRRPTLSRKEENYLRDLHRMLPLKDIPYDETDDYYYTPFFILPDPALYKDIFCDIVLETFNHRGAYDDGIYGYANFFTEKIMKPTLTCRPFMVLANQHYLKGLRDKFGFKTFSDYWDESYDDVTDCRKAIDIIAENMKYINSLSHDRLLEILFSMKNILVHNNKIARQYLEGEEPWINVMKDFIDGNGKAWKGDKNSSII